MLVILVSLLKITKMSWTYLINNIGLILEKRFEDGIIYVAHIVVGKKLTNFATFGSVLHATSPALCSFFCSLEGLHKKANSRTSVQLYKIISINKI